MPSRVATNRIRHDRQQTQHIGAPWRHDAIEPRPDQAKQRGDDPPQRVPDGKDDKGQKQDRDEMQRGGRLHPHLQAEVVLPCQAGAKDPDEERRQRDRDHHRQGQRRPPLQPWQIGCPPDQGDDLADQITKRQHETAKDALHGRPARDQRRCQRCRKEKQTQQKAGHRKRPDGLGDARLDHVTSRMRPYTVSLPSLSQDSKTRHEVAFGTRATLYTGRQATPFLRTRFRPAWPHRLKSRDAPIGSGSRQACRFIGDRAMSGPDR
jgi:hypothetical protein